MGSIFFFFFCANCVFLSLQEHYSGRGAGGGGSRQVQRIPCDQFSCNNLFSPSGPSYTWEHSSVFHHYLSPFCVEQLISTAIPAIKIKKDQTLFTVNSSETSDIKYQPTHWGPGTWYPWSIIWREKKMQTKIKSSKHTIIWRVQSLIKR